MFTGIVEEVGSLIAKKPGSASATLTICAPYVLKDVSLGDSIATNGVCLTVTSFDTTSFTADVMHETLDRSTLGTLNPGDPVNLERAMSAQGRFGGHIVSGHIDGVGRITAIKRDDTAIWYTIDAAPEILRYVIEKGSITLDGISLTVARVSTHDFSVSVIPHTQAHTNLISKHVGDQINIECDVIGKYVEKLLNFQKSSEQFIERSDKESRTSSSSGVTKAFLESCGF